MIEDKIRDDNTESIVRFLAKKGNFGEKFTVHFISTHLKDIYYRKISEILALLTIKFGEIFGYEKLVRNEYYWIKSDKPTFLTWFKEWFGKDFSTL